MTTLQYKDVTTRKEHNCTGCGRKFEAGSKLAYIFGVYQGVANSLYLCVVCKEVSMLNEYEEFGYGELRSGNPVFWENVKRDMGL